MCDSPTCPGDSLAAGKYSCRACFGVSYLDSETRKEQFIKQKTSEKIESACKRMAIAVKDIEKLLGTRVNRDALYRSLVTEDSFEAAFMLSVMLGEKVLFKPVSTPDRPGEELL